jgi:hypothetical protein
MFWDVQYAPRLNGLADIKLKDGENGFGGIGGFASSSLETVPPLANEVASKLPLTPQVRLDEAKPPIPPKPLSPSLSFMSARPFSRGAY